MFDNGCNLISFEYDVHDLDVVQNYSYIHEAICKHADNLAYRYMNT